MTYKENTPTFNVNRKVVNFKDFLSDPKGEEDELKKVRRSTKPNSEDQQHIGNSRYKFNKTTRKMDDLSPAEIDDSIEAIEELEGTNESISKLRAYETRGRFSPDLLIVKINDLIDVINKLEEEVKELKNK
jgi:hypothetical protein